MVDHLIYAGLKQKLSHLAVAVALVATRSDHRRDILRAAQTWPILGREEEVVTLRSVRYSIVARYYTDNNQQLRQ